MTIFPPYRAWICLELLVGFGISYNLLLKILEKDARMGEIIGIYTKEVD